MLPDLLNIKYIVLSWVLCSRSLTLTWEFQYPVITLTWMPYTWLLLLPEQLVTEPGIAHDLIYDTTQFFIGIHT